MKLSQIKVFADALSLSFFNSEQTVGNIISSSLSHRAASGEAKEGRGPNWYVIGRMLLPPSWMGIIVVTPASADAQTSRRLCGFFLSSGHSPCCFIYLIDNSHCQNHISPSHSLCGLICALSFAGLRGSSPRLLWPGLPWSRHALC